MALLDGGKECGGDEGGGGSGGGLELKIADGEAQEPETRGPVTAGIAAE